MRPPSMLPALAVVAVVLAVAEPSGALLGRGAPPCGHAWTIVPSPNEDAYSNGLGDASAVSATDIWAGGWRFNDADPEIFHWNGKSWSALGVPFHGSGAGQLRTVLALSRTNVWAALDSPPFDSQPAQAQLFHRSGVHGSWKYVSSPTEGSNHSIEDLAASGPSNVWAVGITNTAHGQAFVRSRALIEHWNGSRWRNAHAASPSDYLNQLYDASVASRSAAWAVGYQQNSGPSAVTEQLVERFNGSAWTAQPLPAVQNSDSGDGTSELFGVDALSPSDVWVVGSVGNIGSEPLIEHWNGQIWTRAADPAKPAGVAAWWLKGVAGSGPKDLWAIGGYTPKSGTGYNALALHWDGLSWKVFPVPAANQRASNEELGQPLNGIVRVPGTSQVLAVGSRTKKNVDRTLIERICGSPG